jgi:hypothetical protein
MKINIKLSLSLISALFLLAGCGGEAGLGPAQFGNSVRQNIAAQVVNPDGAEEDGSLTYNGERSALAQKHYTMDTVEKAKAPKTSTVAGGGGGK